MRYHFQDDKNEKKKKGQVILNSDEDKEKFGFSFIVG